MALDFEQASAQRGTWSPAHVSLNGATICAWIRPETAAGNLLVIAGSATSIRRFALAIRTADGKLLGSAARINGDTVQEAASATVLSTGTTYHVAVIVDYINSTLKVYINGVEDGTNSPAGWGSASDANASSGGGLGARADGNAGTLYDGIMQDVRFYQRAITTNELADIMRGGTGGTAPRNRWTLDLETGTAATITDAQGNENITAVNTPAYVGEIVFQSAPSAVLLAGLVADASSTVLFPITSTIGPPAPRGAGVGGSTLLGQTGVTTGWAAHYLDFLEGVAADATFLNLGVVGQTTWEVLPTGTVGQPGFAPAVDTTHNITTALAYPGVQFVVCNMNEMVAARDTFGFAGNLATPTTGYVDLYYIPNLITLANSCAAANVPFLVCTSQPRDTGSDADFLAGTAYANTRIYETFGADRVIDFHAYLVDVDGTLIAAYTTDGVHPDDTATPGLSDLVEAKRLELLGSNFCPLVVSATSNTTGSNAITSTVAAVLTGLVANVNSNNGIESSTGARNRSAFGRSRYRGR